MTWLVILAQLVLPVGLTGWLAFAPAKSAAGYIVQITGTGIAFLALALVAPWMLLPWWLAYLFGVLWFLALALRVWRHGLTFDERQPSSVAAWLVIMVMGALGVFAGYLSWEALNGRQRPDAAIVDIALPLGPGTYLVAHGGSRQLVNGHMMTLDPTVERFRAYRGQSYGIDFIKINSLGFRADGLQPRDPAAYEIYGEPVYAPCEGMIIASRDDRPDMPVPVMDLEVIEGNHVLLRCDDVALLLAHFRPGSVRVRTGDRVRVGEQLGMVGNTGKTTEPHLHVSAQRLGSKLLPFSGEPLAITIGGRYLVRNDRLRGELR